MLIGRPTLGERIRRLGARIGVVGAALAATGCGAESTESADPDEPGVTWNRDLAPIVSKKCSGCHSEGGIAPIAFDSYAAVKRYAGQMLAEVESGHMPPWGARTTDECAPAFDFKDDPRLTEREKQVLRDWIDGGLVEGRPSSTPLPKPPSNKLEKPDLHLKIPTAVDVSGNKDRFICFSLETGLESERWINGVQVNPGNAEIVHHVLLYSDPLARSAALADADGKYDCFGGPGIMREPGDDPDQPPFSLLGAWAPGGVPAIMPDDVGLQLPVGSRIVMQVHYHPHASIHSGIDDSTSIDLRFAKETPTYPGLLSLVGNLGQQDLDAAGGKGFGLLPGTDDPVGGPAEFAIPAGAKDHVETERILVPQEPLLKGYRVWGVASHMHYVGRDMKIEVEHPDGSTECLLQTPDWDFDWQRVYYYDAPLASSPVIRPGDVLRLRCTYDNSMENEAVRRALDEQGLDAPVRVKLGEETLDEMCLGAFGVAIEAGL
jgi:hypothetical protein